MSWTILCDTMKKKTVSFKSAERPRKLSKQIIIQTGETVKILSSFSKYSCKKNLRELRFNTLWLIKT